jgi:hypothetical protein
MSERDHNEFGVPASNDEPATSIFPNFAVSVPLPADTSAPAADLPTPLPPTADIMGN